MDAAAAKRLVASINLVVDSLQASAVRADHLAAQSFLAAKYWLEHPEFEPLRPANKAA